MAIDVNKLTQIQLLRLMNATPLGNILTDDWKGIWEHDLCKRIRNRGYLDGDCVDCGMNEVCGGGCPLSREHGDYICLDRHSHM